MDALKHKVHTAYKVREPNPRSLHPTNPHRPFPRARPSIFSVSFQTRVPDTDVHVVDSRASHLLDSSRAWRSRYDHAPRGVLGGRGHPGGVRRRRGLPRRASAPPGRGRATRSAGLPEDKQFLVTRNVPCLKRARAMEEYAGKEDISPVRTRGGSPQEVTATTGPRTTTPDMDEYRHLRAESRLAPKRTKRRRRRRRGHPRHGRLRHAATRRTTRPRCPPREPLRPLRPPTRRPHPQD